jgi:hypothetical protein
MWCGCECTWTTGALTATDHHSDHYACLSKKRGGMMYCKCLCTVHKKLHACVHANVVHICYKLWPCVLPLCTFSLPHDVDRLLGLCTHFGLGNVAGHLCSLLIQLSHLQHTDCNVLWFCLLCAPHFGSQTRTLDHV